jgi:hypothetical protein
VEVIAKAAADFGLPSYTCKGLLKRGPGVWGWFLAPLNQIEIDHPTASRVGDSYRLKDLNPTNGIQINGVLATEADLKEGDKILFGSVKAVLPDVAANGGQAAGFESSGREFPSKREASS